MEEQLTYSILGHSDIEHPQLTNMSEDSISIDNNTMSKEFDKLYVLFSNIEHNMRLYKQFILWMKKNGYISFEVWEQSCCMKQEALCSIASYFASRDNLLLLPKIDAITNTPNSFHEIIVYSLESEKNLWNFTVSLYRELFEKNNSNIDVTLKCTLESIIINIESEVCKFNKMKMMADRTSDISLLDSTIRDVLKK